MNETVLRHRHPLTPWLGRTLAGVVEATYLRGERVYARGAAGSAAARPTAHPSRLMTTFTELVDVAAERLGGAVLLANDEFFAPKENLLKAGEAGLARGRVHRRGKWMDGWETRRRRTPGHDWCIVRLGVPGVVHGVVVDTSFFRGNYPEQCSLEACAVDGAADAEALAAGAEVEWTEILPRSPLRGDAENPFAVAPRSAGSPISASTSIPTAAWRGCGCTASRCPIPALQPGADRRPRRAGERRPGRRLQRHVLRPPAQPDPARPLHPHGRRLGDQAPPRARPRLDHRAAGGPRARSAGSRSTPITSRATRRRAARWRSATRRICTPEWLTELRCRLDHAAPAHRAPGRRPAPVRRVGAARPPTRGSRSIPTAGSRGFGSSGRWRRDA